MTIKPLHPENSENVPVPALCDAEGNTLNRILIEHARHFTLQYLRHTIQGEPMEQEFVEGSTLGKRGKPSAVQHHPSELIVRPTEEERLQYTYKRATPQPTRASLKNVAPSGYLDKYFADHYLPARTKGLYKDIFDAQRAAMMVVMERVLDSVQNEHADGFVDAQGELEKVIAVSIHIIYPQLVESGVNADQTRRLMEHMYDETIAASIHNHVDSKPEAEKQEFWHRYEEALNEYNNAKAAKKEFGLWQRREALGDNIPITALPKMPYTTRVRLQGRDLLDGHRAILGPFNDNEGPGR